MIIYLSRHGVSCYDNRKGSLPFAEKTVPDGRLRDERNRHLYQALDALNTEYRQVLFLLYFEQMSVEESAAVMKKNAKQIYNLSHRGREALRKQLERMGFEYEKYYTDRGIGPGAGDVCFAAVHAYR